MIELSGINIRAMKTLIGVLLLFSSFSVFGQFPEPKNLEFGYTYIPIDDAGYCAGQWVYGPTYCSLFSWSPPDTSSANATFEHYKLYYYSYPPVQDTTILTTTTDTYFQMEIGILGEVWVTAVYSNPDGESPPSNIVVNEELPIAVQDNPLRDKLNILYDNLNQQITVTNPGDVSRINIFNMQGGLIISETKVNERIGISHLPEGLYVIELNSKDQTVTRLKIIK